MSKETAKPAVKDQIVDSLYDIALDPNELQRFIQEWTDAGLDAENVRRTINKIEAFDTDFQSHLDRADMFLSRHGSEDQEALLREILEPFDASAAMILNAQLNVVAVNAGAANAYALAEGNDLSDLQLYDAEKEELIRVLTHLARNPQAPARLLNFESMTTGRPVIFHVKRLGGLGKGDVANTEGLVLVVTTEFYWAPELNQTLEEVFTLSSAERSVVQALVEGKDAKAIADLRGTSVDTVRTQIRAILGKTKSRSQSELIRLVLSLRDVIGSKADASRSQTGGNLRLSTDWLDAEVWKPLETMTLADGRQMQYHVQGPADGAPILFSHMGYGQLRWPKPILKLAYRHGLRAISPVRPGYGQSDNVDRTADLLPILRSDTCQLLDHLGIARLPYLTQGNDLIFAADFAAENPERVSEIIGLGARAFLPGDGHYAGMGRWHRFFLSTAQHAPHLLFFTARAAFSLARKIGGEQMFRNMNMQSPADMRLLDDPDFAPVLVESAKLTVGEKTNAAQAYAMELLLTESDWSARMFAAQRTPTWFVNGTEDPMFDMATISAYREVYPWVEIETVERAGQLLFFQHYQALIPRIAKAARAAQAN